MAHRTSLGVEGLEERTLLSSLSYSLTTDQPVYQVGQPIELTFTETNVSSQPVTVEVSPTNFTISRNNAAIWQSDPADAGQSPTSETLLPGQSVSQTASWNGTTSYSVSVPFGSSQNLAINNFGSFTVSNPNAPQGLNATFQITDPITYSLTTNQSVYQIGQPVQMTFTEVNTSDQSLTIAPQQPAGFSIFHNGTPVMLDALPDIVLTNPTTLRAGQTITDTQTWNGIPMFGPYTTADLTGNFVADYGPGNNLTQLTTTFQITPPTQDNLVTSVTTDQASYTPGQPVNMTFTETNDSTQPVPIVTGAPEFQVMQKGTVIWNAFDAGSPALGTQPSWSTLQPGQSYSQTFKWNGTIGNTSTNPQATGTFIASDLLDPNNSSATFQIVSTPYATPPSQNPGSPITNPTPVTPIQTPITPITPIQNPVTPPSSASPSPIVATLSTDQSAYKTGQSVHISLMLKNLSTQQIVLSQNKNVAQITVIAGSTEVYQSNQTVHGLAAIKPGQTVKLTSLWSGKANQPGVKKLSLGTYTIQVDDGGYVASTTVQISSSHVKSQAKAAHGGTPSVKSLNPGSHKGH
jgi:hypothetical protein